MYEMTLKELSDTLEYRRKGLAYELWKQATLITMGVADLLKDKKSKNIFPNSPAEASPELYPPRIRIKKPSGLSKKYQ